MNRSVRVILASYAAALAVACLWVPWNVGLKEEPYPDWPTKEYFAGYYWVWEAPRAWKIRNHNYSVLWNHDDGQIASLTEWRRIDSQRIALEVITLTALFGIAFLLTLQSYPQGLPTKSPDRQASVEARSTEGSGLPSRDEDKHQGLSHGLLTRRFDGALLYASHLHANQNRKGTTIPYVTHLLSVAALVLDDGGGEDEAIAALLHDAVEDQGGKKILEEITLKFGDRVASIVEGCSDSDTIPKPEWKPRKEKFIEQLHRASPEGLRVMLADKLHNARCILADLRRHGPVVWNRFNGGKEGTLWYYQTLVGVFRQASSSPMVDELERAVFEIDQFAKF